MSQRIVTECDECLTLGETSDARTVAVRALSVEVEVDLCDRHVKPLVEVLERLAELGRPPGMAGPSTKCPRCLRTFATPQALGRHTRKEHGETVHEARKATPPRRVEVDTIACPECNRTDFASTQGLAVHRRRKHAVEGSSRATASRRAHAAQGEAREGE